MAMGRRVASSILGLGVAAAACLAASAPQTAEAITLFDDDESRFDAVVFVQPELRLVQDPCVPGAGCEGASWFAGPDEPSRVAVPDGFRIGRARAILTGAHGIWSGNFMIDGAPNFAFVEAAISVRPSDGISMRIGRFKSPFGIAFLAPLSARQLTDGGSLPRLGFGWQTGAQVDIDTSAFSDTDAVALTLGVFTPGQSIALGTAPSEQLAMARISVSPFGQFGYQESDRRNQADRHDMRLRLAYTVAQTFGSAGNPTTAHNANLAAEWEGVSLYAEWMVRGRGASAFSERQGSTGFRLQAGSFIPHPALRDHLEVALRFEQIDPSNNVDGAVVPGSGPASPLGTQAHNDLTAGVNWYFDAHTHLNCSYTSRSESEASNPAISDDVDSIDDDSIVLQLNFAR